MTRFPHQTRNTARKRSILYPITKYVGTRALPGWPRYIVSIVGNEDRSTHLAQSINIRTRR